MNIKEVIDREKPIKHIKYSSKHTNHLTNEKKEKEYEYYVCDECKKKIVITKNKDESKGGIVNLPKSLTKSNKTITVALHNYCLNQVLRQFEPERIQVSERGKYGRDHIR